VSGWIKLEKDLLTDPRFVAAAMELEARFELISANEAGDEALLTDRNVTPLPAVTLLIGGLARLWVIADTHIGQDDVLALNAHQVDKLVGIDGFCEILPDDWLEILDGDRVKLPNYHRHNGTTAKERSSNAERQARFRASHRDSNNKHSNAVTLPDQDLDKTYTKTKKKVEGEPRAARSATASRLPADFGLTPERRAIAEAEKADPDREFANFTDHWRSASGAKARKHDWDATWRIWCRRAPDFRPRGNGVVKPAWVPPKSIEELEAEERDRAQR